MVRVKERSPEAIVEALESGAGYSSTGPQIFDIQLHSGEGRTVEVTVKMLTCTAYCRGIRFEGDRIL